jgi:quinol monooxygenase YgiN
MYARSTTIRGNPQAMDDGIAYVRDKVMPAVRQMDKCVGLSMLCEPDSGRCIVTSAWADADAMKRSADAVMPMREKVTEIMGGEVEVAEWEIAVMHRKHETHHGACARLIWGQADPGKVDRAIDTFRMALIPRIEELPGFCSVSVMVDRDSGRSATTVTYDSRESMKEAEGPGTAMRQEFASQMDMEITDVATFDIVLAHLRVPETV